MDTPSNNFELPQPQSAEGSYGFTPEAPVISPETAKQPSSQPQGVNSQPPVSVPYVGPTQVSTPASAIQQAVVPQQAADVDLIEKVWVSKAKEIINKTRDDPRTQSDELAKVKVEYKKLRFNKELKTDTGT